MTTLRSRIIGTGSYLPKKVLTNADLASVVDTSDDWIVKRTGIRQRHIAADGERTSDLGVAAAREALKAAGVDAAGPPPNRPAETATRAPVRLRRRQPVRQDRGERLWDSFAWGDACLTGSPPTPRASERGASRPPGSHLGGVYPRSSPAEKQGTAAAAARPFAPDPGEPR